MNTTHSKIKIKCNIKQSKYEKKYVFFIIHKNSINLYFLNKFTSTFYH